MTLQPMEMKLGNTTYILVGHFAAEGDTAAQKTRKLLDRETSAPKFDDPPSISYNINVRKRADSAAAGMEEK